MVYCRLLDHKKLIILKARVKYSIISLIQEFRKKYLHCYVFLLGILVNENSVFPIRR